MPGLRRLLLLRIRGRRRTRSLRRSHDRQEGDEQSGAAAESDVTSVCLTRTSIVGSPELNPSADDCDLAGASDTGLPVRGIRSPTMPGAPSIF